MGNVNFHWPHEGWAQDLACRYVQPVGVRLMGTASLKSPHSASNLPLPTPHTPWGAITFLLLFSPSAKMLSPSLSAAAERHSPGKWLQVCHAGSVFLLSFSIVPPQGKCPEQYTWPDKDGRVHRQGSLCANSPLSPVKPLRASCSLVLSISYASLLLLSNHRLAILHHPRQRATFQSTEQAGEVIQMNKESV